MHFLKKTDGCEPVISVKFWQIFSNSPPKRFASKSEYNDQVRPGMKTNRLMKSGTTQIDGEALPLCGSRQSRCIADSRSDAPTTRAPAMTLLSANIESPEARLANSDRLTQDLKEQHQLPLSWTETFDNATPSERKLIASHLIRAVTRPAVMASKSTSTFPRRSI